MLSQPDVVNDMENYTALNKEFSEINPIVSKYNEYIDLDRAINDAKELLESDDQDMVLLAEEEIAEAANKPEIIEQELKLMLLQKDHHIPENNLEMVLDYLLVILIMILN